MLQRISDFGKAGLNTDVEATMLNPGEWSLLSNIDLESGDIRSAWGDTLVTSEAPIVPLYTFVFEGIQGTYLIVSDGDLVYSYSAGVWTNITPVEGPQPSYIWDDTTDFWDDTDNAWDITPGGTAAVTGGQVSFTVFLGTLIIGFSEGVPAYWPETAAPMLPLEGWPADWRADSIIAYRNFLVAIGLNDSTTAGPKYTVGWSDAAAAGSLPTSWEPTPENLAGLIQLRDTDGYLVLAKELRDDLIIYKNDSIYRMFYTGDEFIFGVERVITDHGCDSFAGVSGLANVHYFADRGDIRIFDGQQTQSIAIIKIKEALASAISNSSRDKTMVVAYPERDEVWVAVVTAGSQTADNVLVFSTVYNAWTLKKYLGTVSMTLGPFSNESINNDSTWDNQPVRWDNATDVWNLSAYEPSEDGMIFGTVDSEIYRADKTHTDKDGVPKTCSATRQGFTLPDLGQRVTLRAIYPEMEGTATVQIQVGGQWYPGDEIRWTPYQDFTPGTQRKLNVRMTGQPTAFRIKSNVADGWRLGALSFDVVPAGSR